MGHIALLTNNRLYRVINKVNEHGSRIHFLVISHIEDFNSKNILNNCLNIYKTKSDFEPLVLPTFE